MTVSGDASLLCNSDLICLSSRKLLLYTTTEVKGSGVCHSVTWTLITHILDTSKTNQKRAHACKCTEIPAAVRVWSLLDSDLAEQSLWLILGTSLMTVGVGNEKSVCVCKKVFFLKMKLYQIKKMPSATYLHLTYYKLINSLLKKKRKKTWKTKLFMQPQWKDNMQQ